MNKTFTIQTEIELFDYKWNSQGSGSFGSPYYEVLLDVTDGSDTHKRVTVEFYGQAGLSAEQLLEKATAKLKFDVKTLTAKAIHE